MRKQNYMSVKKMIDLFDIDKNQAIALRKVLASNNNVYAKMQAADDILEGFGVEYIKHKDDDYCKTLGLEYINMGDSYKPTLIYDYRKQRFLFSTPGDILETEKKLNCYL